MIWVAYLAIPVVLLYFTWNRRVPFSRLFWVFAVFILSCGLTHLVEAISNDLPVYRLLGLMKVVTALASWTAVIVLIPAVPPALGLLKSIGSHVPRPERLPAAEESSRRLLIALLAGILAVLMRLLLDPLMQDKHPFMLSLLAVVAVAWYSGFWPAVLTHLLSFAAMSYLFVPPRGSVLLADLGDQIGGSVYLFGGVACAMLGEAQRQAKARAAEHLAALTAKQVQLEAEIEQRRRVGEVLRQNAGDLLAAQLQTAHTLAQLDTFLDNAPIGLAFFDRDLRFVRVNRYLARANRLPVEAHLGHTLSEALPRLPADTVTALRTVLQTGQPIRDRVVVEHPELGLEQQPVWQVSGYPIQMPGGEVLGVGVLAEDITARLAAERALRHSERQFRLLAETIPHLVWTSDAGGRLGYLNRHWTVVTGTDTAALLADGLGAIVHPDDWPAADAAYQEAIRSGQHYIWELRVHRACDDSYRWHLASGLPIRDESGHVLEWVGTLTDVDDHKRQAETLERLVHLRTQALEQEIEERRRAEEGQRAIALELQRSNRELERFAYVASHDLQEPLRKIQAFADRLTGKFGEVLGETGRDYLARMTGAAGRMRQLIEDLLALSRVTTKGQAFVPVDLAALVRDVLADLEVRLQQTGGQVEVGPLPEVTGDPVQLRQLVQNLLSNALKFHKPGEPPLVRVWGEGPLGDDGGYRLTVVDNGIGFDPKYGERIFQIFQRLHGRTEYEGTGIGLAICRKIAERHGGAITADAVPGVGATFTVSLPACSHAEEDG